LFGPIKTINARGGVRGQLGINAEDTVDMLVSYFSGLEVLVHLDYLQNPPVRIFNVIGTKGSIKWDFYDGKVIMYKYDKPIPIVYNQPKSFERNQMYIDEVKYFMFCLDKNLSPFNDLSESIPFLKSLLKIKKQLIYVDEK